MTTGTLTESQKHAATSEMAEAYQRDGFVKVPGLLTPGEATEFAPITLAASDRMKKLDYAKDRNIFDQSVNAWREDPDMRRLTLHPRIAAAAEALAGRKLRLWHDQILIKRPGKSAPTDFHQDQPYWPHVLPSAAISCWIALVDVPVERGCMTFIPGFQNRDDLGAKNLTGGATLFDICPEMSFAPRITLPLRAGDATFHSGRTPHMANANETDQPRIAHVVIFIEENTRYSGGPHIVTDGLGLSKGDVLDHELFPLARDFASI
jgi:phytanoyl-CoA hydroxylase